jgi:hypothetical protein
VSFAPWCVGAVLCAVPVAGGFCGGGSGTGSRYARGSCGFCRGGGGYGGSDRWQGCVSSLLFCAVSKFSFCLKLIL